MRSGKVDFLTMVHTMTQAQSTPNGAFVFHATGSGTLITFIFSHE